MDKKGFTGVAKISITVLAVVAILVLVAFSTGVFADWSNGGSVNVSLISPANGSFISTDIPNFTFTPYLRNSSAVMGNCTLVTNITRALMVLVMHGNTTPAMQQETVEM